MLHVLWEANRAKHSSVSQTTYAFEHVYLLVSSYWAFVHLKRTPQSLSSDRQKGTAKIQTKDTSI